MDKEEGLVDVMHLENDDAFALVKCGANEKLARGFNVHHRSLLVPPAMKTAKGGASRMGGDSPPPDVLVIEIDSLSRAAARRHLPKLMQLLDTHPRILGRYIDVELKLLGVAGSIWRRSSPMVPFHDKCIKPASTPSLVIQHRETARVYHILWRGDMFCR